MLCELQTNQLEVKETCSEVFLNNSIAQSNNFKINIKLKVEETCKDFRPHFYEINRIAPSFYLVLSKVYSQPSNSSNMERFAKTVEFS